MRLTESGIELIKSFEGFRSEAYRDPAGVWTIGYGHTSAAGEPRVAEGMTVSRSEADAILRRDAANFSRQLNRALRVQLTDEQFSALVSFTYNVGPENLRRSSVLEAVNKSDFASVPRRLSLWTKAGGRVLPGLVKRRAAEAAMFVGGNDQVTSPPQQSQGKPVAKSTSILAAILTAILAGLQAIFGDAGPVFAALLLIGISAALAWIVIERIRKIRKDGV
jgi:lysozyme